MFSFKSDLMIGSGVGSKLTFYKTTPLIDQCKQYNIMIKSKGREIVTSLVIYYIILYA